VNTLSFSLTSAEFIYDGLDSLRLVRSEYLSHIEDVPNPYKQSLKTQLDYAELQVNLAENSCNSAVNSHNIYPTNYSLTSVNIAKNNYIAAIDRYNTLVNTYNLTPTTISRAVNMPYTYQEGRFRIGWSLGARFEVNGKNSSATGRSISSDNVRIGTKYQDVNLSRRRDDPLDIDMSTEALFMHMNKAFKNVFDELNSRLLMFRYSARKDLHQDEQRLLAWVLHPWGTQRKLADRANIPAWAQSFDLEAVLKLPELKLSEVVLVNAASKANVETVEAFTKEASGLVCQIMSESKLGGLASGSGVLVSGDGLILTCAHSIMGRSSRVAFHEGQMAGDYEGEVVYII